jgi:hypothetical protein
MFMQPKADDNRDNYHSKFKRIKTQCQTMHYYFGIRTTLRRIVDSNVDNVGELVKKFQFPANTIFLNRPSSRTYNFAWGLTQGDATEVIQLWKTSLTPDIKNMLDEELLFMPINYPGPYVHVNYESDSMFGSMQFEPVTAMSPYYDTLVGLRKEFNLEDCPLAHAIIIDD